MKNFGHDYVLPLFMLQLPQKTLSRFDLQQKDWEELLAELLDIDVGDSTITDTLITLDEFAQVVRHARNLFGRERFLQAYLEDIRARHMGPVGLAMEAAPTIEDSMRLWHENSSLLAPCLAISASETEDVRNYEIRLTADLGDITETYMELALLMTAGLIRNLSCGKVHAGIRFAHAAVHPVEFYEQSFQMRPEFGCREYSLSFRRSEIAGANDYYAPLIYKQALEGIRALRETIESHHLLGFRLRQYLVRLADDGLFPSVEEAAEHFNMSPRTFTRHLQEEGLSFRDLRNEVQNDIAKRLLRKSTLPIKVIVERAGFSNFSSFCRAFHNANGQTPQEFRKGLAEPGA